MLEIYTSTAADPSGRVAVGVVIRDAQGRTVGVIGKRLGSMSREEASYRALLDGLWRAKNLGARRIRAHADDAEVVAQLQGQVAISPPFVGLYLQTRAMMNAYRWSRLERIERARNAEAALAALDALTPGPDAEDVDSLPLWQSADKIVA